MKILQYPNPLLTRELKEVKTFDAGLELEAVEMIKLMLSEKALGLAANQVGIDKKLIVINADLINEYEGKDERPGPLVIVNPLVAPVGKELIEFREGCLSFKNIFTKIIRNKEISLHYHTLFGKEEVDESINGLLAIVIQHESDHTYGLTMLDFVGEVQSHLIRQKLKKNRGKK